MSLLCQRDEGRERKVRNSLVRFVGAWYSDNFILPLKPREREMGRIDEEWIQRGNQGVK
jgi:hypothetical protein